MPRLDSLQGPLDPMVLKIPSQRARRHGYALMTAIQKISDGVPRVEEGFLNPALHRMMD
jgi:DNA-binding PadR family transcriptional regulator